MNTYKFTGKAGFVLVILIFIFSSCGELKTHRTLKLAHGLPTDHPVHLAMAYMADRCNEISEGNLQIEIYASGQLGSEQQCVELLQIGSLAITKVSAAVMESFTDDYKVLGLPYIFRDKEHAFKVFDGEIGKELLLSTQNKWIRGLCFYDAGSRSFYTIDKPIQTPDDLKGMKIRVMKSKTAMDMVQLLGRKPHSNFMGRAVHGLTKWRGGWCRE
jgi:tripartite ATP-independent transporter DctP family solute receptor